MNNKIYAIGDIHGCFNSLKELIENKIKLKKKDKLIILGDYIDRGPDSMNVLNYIIELQNNNFDVITLLGNHESMLLNAFYNKGEISKWIHNGGNETLKSFKINSLNQIEPKYISFIKSLRYYYELNEYLFVHAGFNDDIENPFVDNYSMLWNSRTKYLNPRLKDKRIIHGHSPLSLANIKQQILCSNKVINIDGGKVYPNPPLGKLVALEINTTSIHYVE